jgi:hypothetical protein
MTRPRSRSRPASAWGCPGYPERVGGPVTTGLTSARGRLGPTRRETGPGANRGVAARPDGAGNGLRRRRRGVCGAPDPVGGRARWLRGPAPSGESRRTAPAGDPGPGCDRGHRPVSREPRRKRVRGLRRGPGPAGALATPASHPRGGHPGERARDHGRRDGAPGQCLLSDQPVDGAGRPGALSRPAPADPLRQGLGGQLLQPHQRPHSLPGGPGLHRGPGRRPGHR